MKLQKLSNTDISMESLELLLQTYFPDYLKVDLESQAEASRTMYCTSGTRRTASRGMFTNEAIKWAIHRENQDGNSTETTLQNFVQT